jgi:Tat protein secretion system quality control protein TatD with DNase activity
MLQVAQRLAEVAGTSLQEVSEITNRNARAVFGE